MQQMSKPVDGSSSPSDDHNGSLLLSIYFNKNIGSMQKDLKELIC